MYNLCLEFYNFSLFKITHIFLTFIRYMYFDSIEVIYLRDRSGGRIKVKG